MKKIIVFSIIGFLLLSMPVSASIQPEGDENSLDDVEIEFKGGFGLKIIVKNYGDSTVKFQIRELGFNGIYLVFVGGITDSDEFELDPNTEHKFFIPILGFGECTLDVAIAEQIEYGETHRASAEAFLYGPFVKIISQ